MTQPVARPPSESRSPASSCSPRELTPRNGNCTTPITPADCLCWNSMKTFVVTGVMTLIASQAFAQTPDSMPPSTRSTATVEADLATPTGHELSAGVSSYTYREPGAQEISIHGAKFVADYTG